MNYQEFLYRLSKTPRQWRLSFNGSIRYKGTDQCPIERVTNTPAHNTDIACDASGLRHSTQDRIISGADNSAIQPRPNTRRDLLKACGLNK